MYDQMTGWLKRNYMAVVIVVSVVVSLVFTTIVYLFSKDWTAAGTVALACFGALGTLFSYITLENIKRDKRPYVSIDIIRENLSSPILCVEIRNNGNTPAHNLEITVVPPKNEDEMLEKGAIFKKMSELSIIKCPIRFLTVERGIYVIFGVANQMGDSFSDIQYKVHANYEDSSGRKYNDDFSLDPSYLFGTPILSEPVAQGPKNICMGLDKVAKEIGAMVKL